MTTTISSGYNNVTSRYERTLSDGTVEARRFAAIDPNGEAIGTFGSRHEAAGACHDASGEAGDDGEGYEVVERWEAV